MTQSLVICKDCGNIFLSKGDINAERVHQRPQCKCGCRDCEEKK